MATRKIKQGDTLSQIALEEKTTVDELAKLNQIQNPDLIQAGGELILPTIEQTNEAIVNPSKELPITEEDVPDFISSEDITDLDKFNIQEILTENRRLTTDLGKELEPTSLERDLQRNLLDIREVIDQVELETKGALLDLKKGGIGTMAGFIAAGGELTERDALKIEVLQREEANLLDRLGLEQEARQIRASSKEQLINMNLNDIDLAFKIQNQLERQRSEQENREQNLSNRQKVNLKDMMGLISGMNPDNLDAQTQAQLATLSSQANIPFDIVMGGLRLDYNQEIADVSGVRPSGGGSGDEPIRDTGDSINTVRQFIKDNSQASREEIKAELLRRQKQLGLSVSQINAELDRAESQGTTAGKTDISLNQKAIGDIASAYVKEARRGFFGRIFKGDNIEEAKEEAKTQIENGVIRIKGKDYNLNAQQINQIKQQIDSI